MSTSGELVLAARPYDDPDVQRLIADVQAEYVRRYGGPDETPVDPEQFAEPTGLFLVALVGGEPRAMGGWRRIDLGDAVPTGEIKRMYVAPSSRRTGLARRLLAELEARAAAAGLVRLVLETGDQQPEAIALYASSGYVPFRPFGHYAGDAQSLHFAKQL